MNIGKFARSLIVSFPDMTNTDVLENVKKKFPAAKTTMACIAWYKSDLRKAGLIAKKSKEDNKPVMLTQEELEQMLAE